MTHLHCLVRCWLLVLAMGLLLAACRVAPVVEADEPATPDPPPPVATNPGSTPSSQQPHHAIKPWLPGSAYNELFNQQRISVITGTVEGVDTFAPQDDALEGLALTVKTDTDSVVVHLGPRVYVRHQVWRFNYHDQVRIVGALAEVDGKTVLLARQVNRGEQVLELRDNGGQPLWTAAELNRLRSSVSP